MPHEMDKAPPSQIESEIEAFSRTNNEAFGRFILAITGVTLVIAGLANLAKGDYVNAALTAGAGAADLGYVLLTSGRATAGQQGSHPVE